MQANVAVLAPAHHPLLAWEVQQALHAAWDDLGVLLHSRTFVECIRHSDLAAVKEL
jgi:hypothetical protein